ncbi:hypothetical protein [Nocardioides sp. TF02-7]|nr:hypothetical protein [Nocardioides sp. TF02-7]
MHVSDLVHVDGGRSVAPRILPLLAVRVRGRRRDAGAHHESKGR